ncbi:MAG: aminoglycoside phosphotransferase family protein [Treponema sp.]|nr:aminoglycoside phosphotransferase family protein [Treponema sp.]MBR5645161.1 aminoglycoside phosphotransferase family protein [Treponema sp.]
MRSEITILISQLFETLSLVEVIFPITPVSGGFMHRMYKVCTANHTYAVKHLNSEIMKRPAAMDNYKKAERLEAILEGEGIPIVPALNFDGKKMQELLGNYFYIFEWHEGNITDWNNITPEQCWKAGNIQGRIHAIETKQSEQSEPELCTIDWNEYLKKAAGSNTDAPAKEVESLLKGNLPLLDYAQTERNKARKSLPNITTIIDEDMDPKNVMWENDEPVVIDLECLDYGNPVSSAIQLSLQWSGITLCDFDVEKQKAFFQGYFEAYDNGFRDYKSVFGLTYTWIEWLEYNIQRALGSCQDKSEQELGLTEVKNTINRIKYIHQMEDKIKSNLEF